MYEYDEANQHDSARPVPESERGLDQSTQRAIEDKSAGRMRPEQLSSLQRAAGNAGVAGLIEEDAGESVRSVIGSGGQSLDPDTQGTMESQIGADFSSVRVHTGSTAQRSTEAVAARAYTVGENVVLGNSVDPSSDAGQRTLAHELTHVVQQRNGPVDGTESGGVRVSDPSDRFEVEAEETADAVMAGDGPGLSAQREQDAPNSPVQREGLEEEEELQMQREGLEEEEELQMQREGLEEEEELQMQREGEEEEELMMG